MRAIVATALLLSATRAEEVCFQSYEKAGPGASPKCEGGVRGKFNATVGKCYPEDVDGQHLFKKVIATTSTGFTEARYFDSNCSKELGKVNSVEYGKCYNTFYKGAIVADKASAGPCDATPPCKDIVALAQSVPDLRTLVTAVVAGGLVQTLESPGPFTVFAPTNEAFAALPAGTLEKLLKPENKAQLDDILTYHVLAAKVLSTDLKDGEKAKTVEGKEVTAHVSKSGVKINDANVVQADVLACNGVVHVIDAVLLPPSA